MRHARLASAAVACVCVAVPVGAQLVPTAPTVVFESGLGDGAGVWRDTIRKLGDSISVFSYGRPGYDKARVAETPRDACTIATELHTRLAAEGRKPPYVLVGHSLGGQYVYAFARLFPDDVAALVLVDATPMGHLAAMQRELPGAARLLRVMKAVTFSDTMKREFAAQDQCLDTLPSNVRTFPVRVLTRTQVDAVGGERLLRIDRELSTAWSTMPGARGIEPVPGAGHYIQRDRPEFLARLILEVRAIPPIDR